MDLKSLRMFEWYENSWRFEKGNLPKVWLDGVQFDGFEKDWEV